MEIVCVKLFFKIRQSKEHGGSPKRVTYIEDFIFARYLLDLLNVGWMVIETIARAIEVPVLLLVDHGIKSLVSPRNACAP